MEAGLPGCEFSVSEDDLISKVGLQEDRAALFGCLRKVDWERGGRPLLLVSSGMLERYSTNTSRAGREASEQCCRWSENEGRREVT